MDRRGFVTLLGVTLIGGCVRDKRTNEGAILSTETASGTSENDTSTTESSVDTTTLHQSPSQRLLVISDAEKVIHTKLKLVNISNNNVIYNESHAIDPSQSIDLSNQFESGEDYKFSIIHEGERIFELDIYEYAGYEVTILSESSAEITGTVEV